MDQSQKVVDSVNDMHLGNGSELDAAFGCS